MRSLVFAALALLAGELSAATEWLHLSSPNFQIYTNARAADARRTIEYFEQVRDFFMRVKSASVTTRLPVTIVLFRNDKDYRPYSPNDAAAAYYVGDQSRDYIVLSGTGEHHYPIAVHEYMHLLMRHMAMNVPIWLNEGIAEVYSTLKPYAGKVMVGSVPPGRAVSLNLEKWLTPEQMFAVRHDSPEYNEKDRAGILYAQSWMLTHMLLLDSRFSGDFPKFAAALSAGMSSADAFSSVYRRSTAQIATEMKVYFRSNLQSALFDTRLQKMTIAEPETADPFLVELSLARLLMLLHRREEATVRFERLAAEHPKRWEAWEALAHQAWRRNDVATARQHLRRATDLEPSAWHVYWDYARLAAAEREDPPLIIAALQRSLRLNRQNADARIMLGWEHYRAGSYKEALGVFQTVRNIDAPRAPRLFLGIAASAIRLENWTEAESAANQARKFAIQPADVTSAAQMLDFLKRRREFEKRNGGAGRSGSQPVPVPAVPVTGTTTMLPAEAALQLRGLLTHVDCKDTSARLRIQSGTAEHALLISNPDEVIIRNQPGSTVTMSCGPQPAGRVVTVEYVEREDRTAATSGDIKTIEFAATAK